MFFGLILSNKFCWTKLIGYSQPIKVVKRVNLDQKVEVTHRSTQKKKK